MCKKLLVVLIGLIAVVLMLSATTQLIGMTNCSETILLQNEQVVEAEATVTWADDVDIGQVENHALVVGGSQVTFHRVAALDEDIGHSAALQAHTPTVKMQHFRGMNTIKISGIQLAENSCVIVIEEPGSDSLQFA